MRLAVPALRFLAGLALLSACGPTSTVAEQGHSSSGNTVESSSAQQAGSGSTSSTGGSPGSSSSGAPPSSGSSSSGAAAPDLDDDGSPQPEDCNDVNPFIHPAATETPYNGVDDDCDPTTRDDDLDEDGFSRQGGGDCNDDDATVHPGADEFPYDMVDQDCSGTDLTDVDRDGEPSSAAGGADCDDLRPDVHSSGVEACGDGVDQDCLGGDLACTDADRDGDGSSPAAGDCNDVNPAIHPGATETPYNGVDDDCDPATRDDDLDADGFSRRGGGDCNDDSPGIFPGADEIPYDMVDQDCSGGDLTDVDRDGQSATSVGGTDCDDLRPDVRTTGVEVCGDGVDQDCSGADLACSDVDADGDGVSPSQGDCNDADAAIHPGATETAYNRRDDDCNAATPDDDLDGDGFGQLGGGDCNDDNRDIHPGAPEIPYDGTDQDCTGADLTDVDRDGYNATEAGGDDCNDRRPDVFPTGVEVCGDTVDQDCSGMDLVCTASDLDGDGFSTEEGDCNDANAAVNPDATETPYNGVDDDCDPATREDDLDTDGFTRIGGGDCNDDDDAIHPGASEVPYDGIDQDCSGTDLLDVDRDGVNAMIVGGTDCDDRRADVYPGSRELSFDQVDQDCDGFDTVGAPFLISSEAGQQYYPAIAFGGGQYLLAYWDNSVGYSQLRARLVATDGTNLSPLPFEVRNFANAAHQVTQPQVAFNGEEFLVAWVEHDYSVSGQRPKVVAQRVASDGTLLGTAMVFGNNLPGTDAPAVAGIPGGGPFLVAWRDYLSGANNYEMRVRIVTSAGPGTEQLVESVNWIPAQHQVYSPHLASDGTDFFLVYGRNEPNVGADVIGQRVAADGSLVGGRVTISALESSQSPSGLVWNGTHCFVTFTSFHSGATTVNGQLFNPDGTLVEPTPVVVSTAFGGKYAPTVSWAGDRFLVAWLDERHAPQVERTIYVQQIGSDGGALVTAPASNTALLADGSQPGIPEQASDGDKVLLVFQRGQDVFGMLVDP